MKFLIVALGAGLGGGLRYLISQYTYKVLPALFPYGTLIVNILGSFVLGLLIFGMDEKELLPASVKLLLGVGFCGGLTTFSTFSLETVYLLRDSQIVFAGLNVLLNLLLTMAAVYLAYILTGR